MSKINIRKRGNYYEYRIEIARVDNKRQWLSKSGFRTYVRKEKPSLKIIKSPSISPTLVYIEEIVSSVSNVAVPILSKIS